MKRVVLFVVFFALIDVLIYGQKVYSFHTIGYNYQRHAVVEESSETDSLDVDDYIDEGNVCTLSDDSVKVYWPMVSLPLRSVKITSPFGWRRDPLNRARCRYHSGIDMSAHYENVYSILPGIVTATAYSKTGGNYITVNHGVCSCSYLHLSKIRVGVGQHVKAGQNIAVSGNTGSRTTGAHLHLSARLNDGHHRYFNPMLLLGFVCEQLLNYKTSK